ncbi:DNA cytosine methyltransferase [Microbacterium sp.]|uniref:DNA cytosine methyltransferase n=1 Tax=Microbacterium sp. TaxID=51671 RepID=UPI003A8E871B
MITAVDHFAGTGWGVACRWLGIREYGVEIMPEAIRTRRAVGFRTIYRDVWSGLSSRWLVPEHDLFIASPPCQTFSVAGRGEGRKALDQVLALIVAGTWKDPVALRAAGHDLGDDRTALVLTPLAHIWVHRPRMVALEQVPTVLPVWEAIADVLRGLGYSVWTGNLQAEMYGVPQTRKRAILMARLDGPVTPPSPTHSRYYSRTPGKLDPGVLKWVSMAEALGWGMTERPYPTIATGTENGGTDPAALGGSGARKNVYAERSAGRWVSSGDPDNDGGILRLQASDAATIQTFPWGFTDRPAMTVHGHGVLTRGPSGQKQAIMEGLEQGTFIPRPPFTIDTARKPGVQRDDYVSLSDRYEADAVNFTPEEAAVLQSYPVMARKVMGAGMVERHGDRPGRDIDHPAFTIRASAGGREPGGFVVAMPDGSTRKLEPSEAGTFQTYPTPFPFQGGRGKQFLQIGNAVPPLLAHAILSALIAEPEPVKPIPDAVPDEWADFGLLEPVAA